MFNTSLLSLLQLSDPTLPIGGYAHSNGLETYVQKGIVKDVATAKEYVTKMLSQNLQYTDGAFVSLAFDAALENNFERILELDDECTAVKLPREIRQASQKLGMRLLKIFQPICESEMAIRYKEAIHQQKSVGHYSIVFGLYAHALQIPKSEALAGFYYSAAVGMVTNSVKLIPLGQQDGQQILFSLQPLIAELVEHSLEPDRNLIGLCCSGFDIRCMQHEQLYSRLYMS
jgi:urease accessory protein